MSRGDQGEPIFQDGKDFECFLATFGDACERTGWIVHAYVLMENHYHLLLETPEANLVAGMQWLQGTYTVRYNLRHKLRGHLFQGRYKALIMDPSEEGYMRRVSLYIHMNPARCHPIYADHRKLQQYRWSSYPFYLEQRLIRPKWLETDRVLRSMGIDPNGADALRQYFEYYVNLLRQLASASGRENLESDWKSIRRGWCLGEEDFRNQILTRIEKVISGRKRTSYSGEALDKHDTMGCERKLEKILNACGMTLNSLREMKKGDVLKRVVAWALRRHTTVSNIWLSSKLNLGHPANVPGYVRSVEQAKGGKLFLLRRKVEKILKSED